MWESLGTIVEARAACTQPDVAIPLSTAKLSMDVATTTGLKTITEEPLQGEDEPVSLKKYFKLSLSVLSMALLY